MLKANLTNIHGLQKYHSWVHLGDLKFILRSTKE